MKYLRIVLCVVLSALIFVSCSNNSNSNAKGTGNKVPKVSTTAEAEIPEGEIVNDSLLVTEISKNPIDSADISKGKASTLLSDTHFDKLGLDGKKSDYIFMIADEGKTIESVDYFELFANVKKSDNQDGSFSVDTKGHFFVSYDGKKILKRDLATGGFSEIKID